MKKLRYILAVLAVTFTMMSTVFAADVSYETVLSGNVVSVSSAGTPKRVMS